MIKDEEYNDLDFEDEERVDLDFGEVVRVKGNGIKSITVDDNYIFTIHYTNGTTQTIPTTYRDFKNVLDQLTAANSDAKKQIDDISQKISEADEKKVEVAEYADKAKTASDQAVSSAADAAKSAESAAASETSANDSAASALTSANNAKTSETNSAASESNASGYASAADKSAKEAASSASSASDRASSANTSAESAAASAKTASDSAAASSASASNAASAETNSAKSASDAAKSAESAATSETNAGKSAKSAADSASEAAEYAKQTGATIEATKSAEQAKTSETNASTSADNAAKSAESAQNALSEIESKGGNILTSTLSASGWTGTEAPYQYDLSTITSFKACTIGFDSSTGTDEQLKAAQSANIHGGSGTSIYAYGAKPDTNIPIVIEQSNFGSTTGVVASFSGGGGGDGFSIVQIPKVSGTSFAYTGSAQGPTITGLDTTHTVVTGATATEIGSYTLRIALKDKTKSMWADTTTDDKTYGYTIGAITITPPSVTVGSYTYTGSAQGPTVSGLDSDHVAITGATATDSGTYTLTAALKDTSYMTWTDGTTANKTWKYTINKAAGTLTLSADYVTLNKGTTSATVNVSGYNGTVSVKSGDETVATASIDGDTITINSVNSKTGEISVVVTVAATTNYTEISKTIAVKADFLYINTFSNTVANGHLAEVAEALKAGTITTDNLVWAVGDTASISHNGTTYTWVIQNKESTNATGIKFTDGTAIHYVIGMKNCESATGAMNSSNTNSGSWNGSAMRTYCNGTFRNNLPTDVKNAFKQFRCVTAQTYRGSTNQTSNDYFALPAAKEIFGGSASSAGSGTSYSNLTEFNALKQFEWYKTSANRIKKLGDSGSAYWWWERSPYYDYSNGFCGVTSDGGADYYGASSTSGVSPFGCI